MSRINGWWLVCPDGCGWEAIQIVDGKLVNSIQQSEEGSIRAGNPAMHDLLDAVNRDWHDESSDFPDDETRRQLLAFYDDYNEDSPVSFSRISVV